MAHNLAHTVLRGRSYYYNRRVPRKVADSFGRDVVRVNLGPDPARATRLAEALSERLDDLWRADRVMPVDLGQLVRSLEPSAVDLLTCTETYLSVRDIAEKPVWLAVHTLIKVAGNRDVTTYTRSDARQTVAALLRKGNKTATVRRRIGTLHAVVEFGFHEQDADRRNPFARLTIPSEGRDSLRRGVFSGEDLRTIYSEALASGRDTRLVLPVLGETGARLAEVVGLRWQDVCLSSEVIRITPHHLRRLKTQGSERHIPLVGSALEAMKKLNRLTGDGEFIFPRWVRPEGVVATHASNTLNKHIRTKFENLSCHCFRHSMRDRLRNSGVPSELIDQIGGWASTGGIGTRYGLGYNLDRKREAMSAISITV